MTGGVIFVDDSGTFHLSEPSGAAILIHLERRRSGLMFKSPHGRVGRRAAWLDLADRGRSATGREIGKAVVRFVLAELTGPHQVGHRRLQHRKLAA